MVKLDFSNLLLFLLLRYYHYLRYYYWDIIIFLLLRYKFFDVTIYISITKLRRNPTVVLFLSLVVYLLAITSDFIWYCFHTIAFTVLTMFSNYIFPTIRWNITLYHFTLNGLPTFKSLLRHLVTRVFCKSLYSLPIILICFG